MPNTQDSTIRIHPYPDVSAEQPLDRIRLYHRLLEDGYVKKAQPYKTPRPDGDYRLRTLVITWGRAPGARWALNIPEHFGSRATKTDFGISGWSWQSHSDQHCTLINHTNDPKGELRCDYRVGTDRLDIEMNCTLDLEDVLDDIMCQACFNHLWADGFGRDAYALIDGELKPLRDDDPDNEKQWRRFIALEGREDYGRHIWPVYHGAEGGFIATMRHGNDPLTIGFASPDALAVAWSFWPCTDMDFKLGAIGPGQAGKATATIHFLPGTLEVNLDRIKIPAKN
jgi:hypothetical protein